MPRLQDIERFKRDLAALSHEAETLERWGESPEDIPPPPPRAAGANGAESAGTETAAGAAGPSLRNRAAAVASSRRSAPATPDEGLPPDFAALLDALPLDAQKNAEDESGTDSLGAELDALLASPESRTEQEGTQAAVGPVEEAPLSADLSLDELLSGLEEPGVPAESEMDFQAAPPIPAASEGPAPAEADFSFDAAPPAEVDISTEPGLPPEAEASPDSEIPDELEPIDENETGAAAFPGSPTETEPTPFASTIPAGAASQKSFENEFTLPDLDEVLEPESGADEAPAAISEDFSIADFALGEAETGAPEGGEENKAAEPFSFEEPEPAAGGIASQEGAETGTGSASEAEGLSFGGAEPDSGFDFDREWGGIAATVDGKTGTEPPRATPSRPSARASSESPFRAVKLSEDQVDRLQDSLLAYPLNLRIAIEEIIAAEVGSLAQRSELVWGMVEGASAEETAHLVSRIVKRRITVPKGYEKKTGAALEAEKRRLSYILVHSVLPIARTILLVAAAAGALGWLGYRYVYKAIAANAAYRSGYAMIAESRYIDAETSFEKARSFKEYDRWYYRYAEAYVVKRQYPLAERKYAALVQRKPKERQAILDWARLEKEQLKFEEAVKVLRGATRRAGDPSSLGMTGLLSWDYFNEEGLLLLGDVFLDWAEEDPAKYDEARRAYATLIERYGQHDEYMERMLLYFIRTDDAAEAIPLASHYLSGRGAEDGKKIAVSARTLAELGGYLLDRGELEQVRIALGAAAIKDPALPEAHYHFARYFRRSGALDEERKALDNAIKTFSIQIGLGAARMGMYVDSLLWRGRYRVANGEWLSAEQDYAAAAAEYERGLDLRRLKRSPRFAEAYAGLGDVAFWQRDELDAALSLYERAAADGYDTEDTRYRRAYILYRSGRTAEALPLFLKVANAGEDSPYLTYAFGDALYARADYFAAEGSFRRVVESMRRELELIDQPSPQERASQAEIVELLMKAQNNLGAAIYQASGRVGDPRRRSDAMAAFAFFTSAGESLAFAPPATAMLFSPSFATKISATPEGAFRSRKTKSTLIPSRRKPATA